MQCKHVPQITPQCKHSCLSLNFKKYFFFKKSILVFLLEGKLKLFFAGTAAYDLFLYMKQNDCDGVFFPHKFSDQWRSYFCMLVYCLFSIKCICVCIFCSFILFLLLLNLCYCLITWNPYFFKAFFQR